MKKRILIFWCVIIFLIDVKLIYSQQQNLVLKLKKTAPAFTLQNFKNNSPASGFNSLSKVCKSLSISTSKSLFRNVNARLTSLKEFSDIGLDRIFIISVNSSYYKNAISLLSKNEFVEYIEPDLNLKLENNNKTQFTPDDPYYSNQYYLGLTHIIDIWNITFCDSNIVIGVIDSGLDFLHPDLQKSYFINSGEYGNGKESNGIDDDNNGFVDDWRGWNFIDYNNNPADDNKFSHGTGVTGIINASINNGIGIASVAPNSKVLVLKAFDADGNGKESDVASAILYGVSAGVKIFNFSFGDYSYSSLLRDVIRFSYLQNIFISCSAGNDASYALHYPSAFDEVTSVAASDETDSKTSFSSFGVTVDIYAPGSQILSSTRVGKGNQSFNGDYDFMNGTSFSAPIISGIAAMLLTGNHNIKPEEIRGILTSSTSYLSGQTNWDFFNASGRVNGINAFNNKIYPTVAKIQFPFEDYTFLNDTIPMCVSAASPFFSSFSIYYGVGIYPDVMHPIVTNINYQVINDTITKWNTSSLADTSYTLSLVMSLKNGKNIEHNLVVFKDKNSPVIQNYTFGNLIDVNNYSELIEFTSNIKTFGKIYYKRKNVNEPYQFIYADGVNNNIGSISTYHSGLLKSSELSGNTEYEFYLEVISLNGKNFILNDTGFYFNTGSEINSYGFSKKNYFLPSAQICNKILDVFGNGKDNFFINEINNNYRINLYQFSNNQFNKVSNNNWTDFIIARDAGYFTNDNKLYLLCSKSRNGYLYQAPAINQLPTNLVWSDTLSSNFWSSRIADTDGDSLKEILGFGITGLRILENSGNNNFVEIANLPYYGGTTAEPNSQSVLVDNFENDGKQEIIFTNLFNPQNSSSPNTSLQVYKNVSNNNYIPQFSETFSNYVRGENLIEGDFDGDGKKEFALGTLTNENNPSQYFSLYVFKYSGTYSIIDIVNIYNYKPNSETSIKAANIDGDNKDEILVNIGTYFYIFKFDNISQKFLPIYFLQDINSFNQIVYDFDKNGLNEFGLNSLSDTLFFYEKNSVIPFTQTPLNFNAYSVDSNKVFLSFDLVPGADYYKIYRANDTLQNYFVKDSVTSNSYYDNSITNRTNYYYKVSAVDTNNAIRESQLSTSKKVFVHNKSKLVSAIYLNDGYLKLKYSEKINYSPPNPNSFILSNNNGPPVNAAFRNDFEYLLSYGKKLANGSYSIYSRNLIDFYNSPVDSNIVSFSVNQNDTLSFYLKTLKLADKFRIQVEFNLPADSVSASNGNNYVFEPFRQKILSVNFDNSNKSIIYLNLENKGYIGPSGRNYILQVNNVYSVNGIKIIDGAGSSLGLIFTKENLDEVFVYPNPYKINGSKNIITFANLTPTAVIDIYDLTGRFIITVNETEKNGGVDWELKDSKGNYISSGIYLYRVTGKDSNGIEVNEKIGKFAVIK